MPKGKKKKGPAPVHQNTFAFRHNPKSRETKRIGELKVHHMCEKCTRLMNWKKQYRKYKPRTVPAKCTFCMEIKVVQAYARVCDTCSVKKCVCCHCLEEREVLTKDPRPVKVAEKEDERKLLGVFELLSVKEQKAYTRALERDELTDGEEEEEEEEEGEEDEEEEREK